MKYFRKDNNVVQAEEKPEGYHEITKTEYEEVISIIDQICQLKWEISRTDFKAIKYAEGWISEEEYAPIKADRESIRVQIRELESRL